MNNKMKKRRYRKVRNGNKMYVYICELYIVNIYLMLL